MNLRAIARLVAGAVGSMLAPLAIAASQSLNIPVVTQQHSEWCWAADAKAVLTYRGVSTTQCGIDNWVNSINYACQQASFDWNDSANSPNSLDGTTGISGILWYLGRRDSNYYDSALNYTTATSALSKGNPVVVLWTWPDGGGHFIVLDGYDDSGPTLYFMNPWPGEGAGWGDYSWIRDGTGNMGTHWWSESLIVY